ncbi:MAG: hypothetical protein J3K34DRAFT_434252 [Monoraphidium minutum]|nr:MAG: hypothetical protein J3K34DRAFT_434252 [Monoraphidium minutum]
MCRVVPRGRSWRRGCKHVRADTFGMGRGVRRHAVFRGQGGCLAQGATCAPPQRGLRERGAPATGQPFGARLPGGGGRRRRLAVGFGKRGRRALALGHPCAAAPGTAPPRPAGSSRGSSGSAPFSAAQWHNGQYEISSLQTNGHAPPNQPHAHALHFGRD